MYNRNLDLVLRKLFTQSVEIGIRVVKNKKMCTGRDVLRKKENSYNDK